MVAASSKPGGWCLDFFAGSGTLGAAAQELGRRFVLVDASTDAIDVCQRRLEGGATPGSQTPAAR
jgi:site-specific DNA-methyltransferase (adenine-specific)